MTDHGATTPAHRYTADVAQRIEQRWQEYWDSHGTFETPNPSGLLGDAQLANARGDKLFINDMFPYPSGAGLHVGHPLGYIGTDVFARFKRMTGHNVLHTMGFDAFGLPAEQFAVEHGIHPAETTADNVANYRRQLSRMGLGHDKRRSVSTTDPSYYRWTQWIFSQVFNAWFDPAARGGAGAARPIDELVAEFASGERPVVHGPATAVARGERRDDTPLDWESLPDDARRKIVDSYRLAYVSDAPVNWCPGLGTVVANEEVTADGRSDRGNFPVFKRSMRQWMMRITDYAERLLDDLELLDWSDGIKALQRNWIGRSTGARVRFDSPAGAIEVFTTRPDTLFGATFLVLSPEHPLVPALTSPEQTDVVAAYQQQAAATSDADRSNDTRDKTGVFTGSHATNPVNGAAIPIWVADYVLMGYGTGAIMAVPCGDARDFEFARVQGLDIVAIQRPPDAWFVDHDTEPTLDPQQWPTAFTGDAPYINSTNEALSLEEIDNTDDAIDIVTDWLESQGFGNRTVTFKLRDWLFSRQRYWGEPFPIVYDDHGNPRLVPDELLPVELPPTDSFSPRTFDPNDADSEPETPLSRLQDWVTVSLDLGDGTREYRRDTNVMPQWAGSCWYQLRYCDPTNDEVFVDPEVERYWVGPRPEIRPDHPGGVDLYVGGVEHAVLHLLYARFWHKVLFDLGHLSSVEPYYRLFNQGYVQAFAYVDERGIYADAKSVQERDGAYFADGQPVRREYGKMGKSLKNSVTPDEMYADYGADTLRLYEMAVGPLDKDRPWNTDDVIGQFRFLQRVWRNIVDEQSGGCTVSDATPDGETNAQLHRTIAVVREEMDALRFNTAIAKLIELNNHLTKLDSVPRVVAEPMVQMLAPLAPHIAEELWNRLGHDDTVTYEPFPTADPAMLRVESVEYPVQINGKVKGRISVPAEADRDAVEASVLNDETILGLLDGATPTKVIVVPHRMVNLVV